MYFQIIPEFYFFFLIYCRWTFTRSWQQKEEYLSLLSEDIPCSIFVTATWKNTYWRKTLSLSSLWERICSQGWLEITSSYTHIQGKAFVNHIDNIFHKTGVYENKRKKLDKVFLYGYFSDLWFRLALQLPCQCNSDTYPCHKYTFLLQTVQQYMFKAFRSLMNSIRSIDDSYTQWWLWSVCRTLNNANAGFVVHLLVS